MYEKTRCIDGTSPYFELSSSFFITNKSFSFNKSVSGFGQSHSKCNVSVICNVRQFVTTATGPGVRGDGRVKVCTCITLPTR